MSGSAPGITPVPAHRHEKVLRWFSLALIAGVLVAAFVLPLVNISRYHNTISETLARSLGHPVHLGSVKLQLLPRPGLAITDLTVEENQDFGAEPLLRSPSVMVSLRLSSLWRGRLEVSRIELDDASVNLVHNARGQWSFGSLLEQAARIPNAPTAQRHSSGTPRFPYIEFRSARINFKSGNEKKGFAFLNSDLSIWLDNPNQWRLRFEAQPARTDLDLDLPDTGLIRVEGSLNRAAALDQMPVKLHAEWSGAALGQASRLIFADDTGWRGELRAEADIEGDIRDLRLTTRLRVTDAHRQEFSPLTLLNIDARCRGEYLHSMQSLENLTCLLPTEGGHLLLTGDIPKLSPTQCHLTLEINQTPASFALNALGLLRAGLPSSLSANGVINGSFTYTTVGEPALVGQAMAEPLGMAFPDAGDPFTLSGLRFEAGGAPVPAAQSVRRNKKTGQHTGNARSASPLAILLEPATMSLGAPNPVQISGQFTRAGFSLRLTGSANLKRLKTLMSSSRLLHSSMEHLAPKGTSDLDITFAGPWVAEPAVLTENATGLTAGPANAATIHGWMHLENAEVKVDWLPEPVEIASAAADFGEGRVHWSNAQLAVNDIAIRGSGDAALECEDGNVCPVHFNLDIPSLDAAAMQSALLGAGRHDELLEKILAEVERKTAPWPAMRGQAHVGNLTLGNLVLHDVRSSLNVQDHKLEITSLDAATLGGSMHATGTVEASGLQPRYAIDANWSGINTAQIAQLFKEKWPASGAIDGGANLVLKGYSVSDLSSSAQGTFHWLWSAGSLVTPTSGKLANVSLSPTRFSRWIASGNVGNSALTLNKTEGASPVSGTIFFDRKLDLVWPDGPVHLGGTLAHPVIEAP